MALRLARRLHPQRRGPCAPRPRIRSQRGGFTLLETMIALTLLGIGILGVTGLQLTSLKYSRDSRTRTAAMYLATQQMERFNSMTPVTVRGLAGSFDDPANPIHPNFGDADGTAYNRSWTIQADAPEAGLLSISVRVDWVDPNGFSRSMTLRGLKAET